MKKFNKFLYRFCYILGILLIVIGLSTIGLTYWNNLQESNQTDDEISSWTNLPTSDDDAVDGGLSTGPDSVDLNDNSNLWGLIQIDALDVVAPIAKEHNWNLLRKYAVAFAESDLPSVEGGNYSVASHWGYAWCSYCYFKDIKSLKTGDIITVTSRSTVYTYVLYKNPEVILDTQTEILDRIEGQTTLTLITCVTVDDPQRTVVQAKLISTAPRQ